MPAYSFGAVSFGPRAGDLIPQVNAPAAAYSERHVPYSSHVVLDIGGKAARRYAAQIRVPPSSVAALEAKLLQTDVLVVDDVTWPSATLVALNNHVRTPLNVAPIYHFYDAEWIVG